MRDGTLLLCKNLIFLNWNFNKSGKNKCLDCEATQWMLEINTSLFAGYLKIIFLYIFWYPYNLYYKICGWALWPTEKVFQFWLESTFQKISILGPIWNNSEKIMEKINNLYPVFSKEKKFSANLTETVLGEEWYDKNFHMWWHDLFDLSKKRQKWGPVKTYQELYKIQKLKYSRLSFCHLS